MVDESYKLKNRKQRKKNKCRTETGTGGRRYRAK
jgi:hypothetical protein